MSDEPIRPLTATDEQVTLSMDDYNELQSAYNQDERNHNVNESHDKLRLEIDFTRGTGTRDQEKHKLKARGETPKEAAENLSEALEELQVLGVFERARNVGNDDDD